jgi:hypothetical protein
LQFGSLHLPARRRGVYVAFTLAIAGLCAILASIASEPASASTGTASLGTVRVGHFDGHGNPVVDRRFTVPEGQSSGSGAMSPAASRGRLPRSLGGEKVAKFARSVKPRGGAMSRSGSGWVHGSPGYPTPFGCGWIERAGPTVTASWFGSHWDVGRSRAEVDFCWAYGVRIVDWPTGYQHCDLLTSSKSVWGKRLTYHAAFTEQRRNYYTWNGWPKSGVYEKTGCRFTGSFSYDESTWVHVYGHSDGSYYWTSN